jgi:tetratricopeptide (TPR) repeat protein
MKRCPECRRDYYDDSLRYCLDDGSALLDGPGQERVATAILPSEMERSDLPTKPFDRSASEDRTLKAGKSVTDRESSPETGPAKKVRPNIPKRWLLGFGVAIILVGVAGVYFLFFRTTPPPVLTGSVRDVNSPAYDQYLRGRLDSDSENPDRNANAIAILEEVVKADPAFAPAYAELARAYTIRANDWAPQEQKAKLVNEARIAVEKSLVLQPDLAEGHLVRAYVIWTVAGHFPHEQAIQSLKRAVELDPSLVDAHQQLGLIYLHIGLLDKARVETQKAIDINPSDSSARLRLGLIEQYGANYEKALAIIKTVPGDTNPAIVNRAMTSLMMQLGRTDEAARMVDEFLSANPDEGGNVTSVKAMLLAKAGNDAQAEAAIQRAIEIGQGYQHFHHTTYNIASAYAILGKNDEAIKWLQFTADNGFPCYPLFEKDANLDGLRQDPHFVSFMEKLKQEWEQYQSTL